MPRRVATKAPPQETGTPPPPLAHQIRNQCQEEEQNPYPAPLLQVGPGFLIRRVIDDTASQGVDIPETDDGRHFCLSFHLKGMCNSNCGGRHSHRALSQSKFGRLVGWCEKFCSEEAAPPVREVDAGGRSQASTLFSRTGRPRGSQGTQITTGGGERNHPPPPKKISKVETPDGEGALAEKYLGRFCQSDPPPIPSLCTPPPPPPRGPPEWRWGVLKYLKQFANLLGLPPT